MKTAHEILDELDDIHGEDNYSHLDIVEYTISQFQWKPITEAKLNIELTENTIILFDTGEIRRFEEETPFAVSTHYLNLPEPPKEELP